MKKSFTLVELMIVIAILAILSAIVIFTLNPSEIFKKNRDSRRVTDIQTLYKAITFMESWYTSGINYGNANTVYLSLPDSSATCSSYALPTLPTGFTYNCVTSSNLRKTDATGWVPVNFTVSNDNNYLAQLPIDPINSIEYYYSYNPGGSFEVNAFLESNEYILKFASNDGGDSFNTFETGTSLTAIPLVFPHNWIKVPGNSLYNTSDFWVMQYEAKYATTGRTGSDAPDACKNNVLYDTWQWNKACGITWNNQNVVSSPSGSPIAYVTHTQAKAICQSLGAHLITNQEWMTIARNIEQQGPNWTSGTVGTGYLFNGNSGDATRGYNGPDPDKGDSRNARAISRLSNGSLIYDFAGNVWEHVMKDINDTLLNVQPNTVVNDGVWKASLLTALTGYGDLSYDEIRPLSNTYDSGKGVGSIYHYDGGSANPNRVLLRGGSWSDGSGAGSFAVYLRSSAGSASYAVGFRCAR